MCGITAYIGEKCDNKIINSLYQLQNRGYDSVGISSIKNNKFIISKSVSTNINSEIDLLKNKYLYINKQNVIAHTRWQLMVKKI